MAKLHEVSLKTRRECLEGFAESFGSYPPREPVPQWWTAFEKWYVKVRRDGVETVTLRTEPFLWEVDEKDETTVEDLTPAADGERHDM